MWQQRQGCSIYLHCRSTCALWSFVFFIPRLPPLRRCLRTGGPSSVAHELLPAGISFHGHVRVKLWEDWLYRLATPRVERRVFLELSCNRQAFHNGRSEFTAKCTLECSGPSYRLFFESRIEPAESSSRFLNYYTAWKASKVSSSHKRR